MKRIGMLAGLLLLALGTGVAAQSPLPETSPEVSPAYAPEDIATALPASFGEWVVDIRTDMLLSQSLDRTGALSRDLLLPFGKSLDDVRGAMGYGYLVGDEASREQGRPAFQVMALRVIGVPAARLVEPSVRVLREGAPSLMSTDMRTEWQVIDGREVYALVPTPEAWPRFEQTGATNDAFGFYFLTEGEVLYYVLLPPMHPTGSPSLAEVLAELPQPSM